MKIYKTPGYEKRRTAYIEAAHKWAMDNPRRKLWLNARCRARKSGMAFEIEETDIVIPENCPYTGIPLTNIRKFGWVHSNMTLDRIDNTKGYVKGNVLVISWVANLTKSRATQEELIAFARGVLRIHGLSS